MLARSKTPMSPRPLRWLLVFGILALPALAHAWAQKALFGATVHGHLFHDVAVEATDCKLRYELFFSAPEDVYSSKNAARNYYLFRARIKMHGGKAVTLPVFGNAGGGERVYRRVHDTRGEGCWAKQAQKLLGVDVEGCRGRGCTPRSLL